MSDFIDTIIQCIADAIEALIYKRKEFKTKKK